MMTQPFPKMSDQPILRAAALEIGEALVRWSREGDPQDWINAVISCRLHWNDGYQLAKALEDGFHIFDADSELVDELSSTTWAHSEAYKKARMNWAEATGWVSPVELGYSFDHPRFGPGRVNEIIQKEALILFVPDSEKEKFKNGGGIHVYADALEEFLEAAK